MSLENLDRHIFALYFGETLSLLHVTGNFVLKNNALYHRMVHVLRFASGSRCILFDKNYHANIIIHKIHKKDIELTISSILRNSVLSPRILLLLPMLKKQALSEAMYAAVETGVSEIQLIITQKAQRSWGGVKELERLQAVVIAACEQAKYFNVPELKAPTSLEQGLSMIERDTVRVCYDAAGTSFAEFYEQGIQKSLAVIIGPEGDLTQEEKNVLKKHNFTFVRLTPTILRSQQAVSVGIGILRTMM